MFSLVFNRNKIYVCTTLRAFVLTFLLNHIKNYRLFRDGKQPYSDNDDFADKVCEYEQDGFFHSLTRQGILTSTPAVSVISPKSPMAKLRNELERCLLNYKAKREQVTKLHETLYTTRCQLHQSREALEKAEKSAKLLQVT